MVTKVTKAMEVDLLDELDTFSSYQVERKNGSLIVKSDLPPTSILSDVVVPKIIEIAELYKKKYSYITWHFDAIKGEHFPYIPAIVINIMKI